MIKVIKNKGKQVHAYCLGENGAVVQKLMTEGKIKRLQDGSFEVFSQEAVSGKGELAQAEDFVKIDSSGYPYPNDAEFFHKNHRKIEGDLYEQMPAPLDAWVVQEPFGEEMKFLVREKDLVIDEACPERYFTAPLWGAPLSAPKDAVVVFYSIDRDEHGVITDASFNFVCRDEFEKTYSVL